MRNRASLNNTQITQNNKHGRPATPKHILVSLQLHSPPNFVNSYAARTRESDEPTTNSNCEQNEQSNTAEAASETKQRVGSSVQSPRQKKKQTKRYTHKQEKGFKQEHAHTLQRDQKAPTPPPLSNNTAFSLQCQSYKQTDRDTHAFTIQIVRSIKEQHTIIIITETHQQTTLQRAFQPKQQKSTQCVQFSSVLFQKFSFRYSKTQFL